MEITTPHPGRGTAPSSIHGCRHPRSGFALPGGRGEREPEDIKHRRNPWGAQYPNLRKSCLILPGRTTGSAVTTISGWFIQSDIIPARRAFNGWKNNGEVCHMCGPEPYRPGAPVRYGPVDLRVWFHVPGRHRRRPGDVERPRPCQAIRLP